MLLRLSLLSLPFTTLASRWVTATPSEGDQRQAGAVDVDREDFRGQKIFWHSLDPLAAENTEEHYDDAYRLWINHTSAARTDTASLLTHNLRLLYPSHHLTVTAAPYFNLFGYVYAHASTSTLKPISPSHSLVQKVYFPPAKRQSGPGGVGSSPIFAAFELNIDGQEWVVYLATWVEGYITVRNWFLFYEENEVTKGLGDEINDALILEVSSWGRALHEEVLVFDQYWQPNHDLWKSVQGAYWEDIILDANLKGSLRADVEGFYQKSDVYKRLNVAYKRGIIFRGPPGNGKSFSLKAIMNYLYSLPEPIPVLYVKSFKTWMGDEGGIRAIFQRAREEAPCLLILEDLDSLITDANRSFFLNEVDGLESNDGVLMIGTTNHFDQLDPALKNRPSRFDRKYDFPDPSLPERIQYCRYWQKKLKGQKEVIFGDKLLEEIAVMMEKFSFAYMKEAFVSTLLVIAGEDSPNLPADYFGNLVKKQIEELKKEVETTRA